MVLNDFRSQVIEWDKATGGIYESVSASKGDSNGRKLIVHVLNEREEEDLTGSVLSLGWNLKENQGLDAFVPIDETKGIFEIYYTTGMLSNIGTLTASLVLVTPDGRIESKPFKIFVQESVVDDTAVQSQNSFTTLTQAIVQFAEWGSRFEAVEQDYKDRAAALETTYAPRLISAEQDITTNHQEVTAQLAQKAELDSVFSMANMGQDIKTALTGGSVAVVGKGGVLTENIVSKQVTPITTNFFDLVDFMELHSISFTANEVGLDGVFTSISPTSRSLIFRVEPNTNYKLKFNGFIGDRGNVIGNNNNDFVVGQTYQTLAINARENDVITFSTTSTTTYVCVYFHSNGNTLEYYEANKAQLSLYKDRLPVNTYPTIKKNNLPTDILYTGEVEPGDTTFFTFYNLLEKNTPQFLNAHCDIDGKVTLNSNSRSLVIEVEANTTYHLQLPLESDRAFVLSSEDVFDSGKIYPIIDVTVLPNKKYTFTTKQNTKRVFIYYHSTSVDFDKSSIELVVNSNDFGKGTQLKSRFSASSTPYVGKKIMTLGDSITAIPTDVRGWQKYFNEIIKPSNFDNVAVSGATWCDKVGTVYDGNPVINGSDNNVNNVIGNQVQKIINNAFTAPDIIIIAAGTNDDDIVVTDADIELQFFSGETNVLLENVDRKTWAGAVRYTIETLRGLYPNAQIFITTPLQRANAGSNYYDIVRRKNEIIKKLGLRMSVPVIDTLESNIYGMTAISGSPTLDHSDGLHLSAVGAEKMGKYVARKIVNWYSF